jgi:hypothetical protein
VVQLADLFGQTHAAYEIVEEVGHLAEGSLGAAENGRPVEPI